MTKEELSIQLSQYILSNWDTLTAGFVGVLGSIIVGTWFAAKYWYQREIKHVNDVSTANDKLATKQIAYMSKQIEHKESYARGVVEVMNQRILAAEEEPKRLLRVIQQQEQQLAHYQAMSLKAKEELINLQGRESRDVFVSYSFSRKSEIEEILRDIFDRDPDDSGISIVKNEYSQIKEDVWSKTSNLSAMVGLMGLLLRLQNEKIFTLNMDINTCHVESSISYINFYKSIKKIIAPVTGNENKNYIDIVKDALERRNNVGIFNFDIETKRLSNRKKDDESE